jgi:hypothetical protein
MGPNDNKLFHNILKIHDWDFEDFAQNMVMEFTNVARLLIIGSEMLRLVND